MSSRLIWNDRPLKAAHERAVLPAAQVLGIASRTRAAQSSRSVAASVRVTQVDTGARIAASHPNARLVEFGARPHTIGAEGRVLKLDDGGFVTGPVRHPGTRSNPFLRSILPQWGDTFRRVARVSLAAAGFRVRV